MVSDLDCANACADLYLDIPNGFHRTWVINGIVIGMRRVGTDQILAFRGSKTLDDWMRDFLAIPIHIPEIGHVHKGFAEGVEGAVKQILPELGPSLYVTGHSLGAAHAAIAAAWMIHLDAIPRRLVMIACPKPGFADLQKTIIDSQTGLSNYANAGDPVPEVPEYIPEIAPFLAVITPTPINDPPAEDYFGAAHNIKLYQAGIARLNK